MAEQRDTQDVIDERGVTVTAGGRARMRAKMDAAANRTPIERAAARETFLARLDAA